MKYILQPNIYESSNSPHNSTLLSLLELIWNRDLDINHYLGKGTIYIMSGFSNFNGGVRFYNRIADHISNGGKCKVILGGSTRQNMSSKQVVRKLLEIGCEVNIINRKAIFHAKCYGFKNRTFQSLIVSSGNFTSRGISQNIEASVLFENNEQIPGFDWEKLFKRIKSQNLDIHQLTLDESKPGWRLLFDENRSRSEDSDSEELRSSMIITLGHNDTSRIQANRGENAGKGTQYFWLSKDSFDFFPALNDRNSRGTKSTYQTTINVNYIDLNVTSTERVTFEAENNYDFRLGTSTLRYTRIASINDMAVISRISDRDYEMRIYKPGSEEYRKLIPYATNFIGNRGKKYGYIPNDTLTGTIGITLRESIATD